MVRSNMTLQWPRVRASFSGWRGSPLRPGPGAWARAHARLYCMNVGIYIFLPLSLYIWGTYTYSGILMSKQGPWLGSAGIVPGTPRINSVHREARAGIVSRNCPRSFVTRLADWGCAGWKSGTPTNRTSLYCREKDARYVHIYIYIYMAIIKTNLYRAWEVKGRNYVWGCVCLPCSMFVIWSQHPVKKGGSGKCTVA